jgi:hypothetical protein
MTIAAISHASVTFKDHAIGYSNGDRKTAVFALELDHMSRDLERSRFQTPYARATCNTFED